MEIASGVSENSTFLFSETTLARRRGSGHATADCSLRVVPVSPSWWVESGQYARENVGPPPRPFKNRLVRIPPFPPLPLPLPRPPGACVRLRHANRIRNKNSSGKTPTGKIRGPFQTTTCRGRRPTPFVDNQFRMRHSKPD